MIYLASNSPRRAELLQQIECSFIQVSGDIEEVAEEWEQAIDYVQRLARQKAQQGLKNMQYNKLALHPVLGADTIVVIDNVVLEKPKDEDDARKMMLMLSAHTHSVYTAIALADEKKIETALVVSKVTFKTLCDDEISAYWKTGEPQGKAGGYAIQGTGAKFISHLDGSYSAVMGLPLFETSELITHFKETPCL